MYFNNNVEVIEYNNRGEIKQVVYILYSLLFYWEIYIIIIEGTIIYYYYYIH